jgi:hypothetical protein
MVLPNSQKMKKTVSAPPYPYETMLALSSMGYDFSQAIADVIDNSIDAGSSKIDIASYSDEGSADSAYLLVMDNGAGMNQDRLHTAMTLGGTSSGVGALGKFGMGMKTASLSQCDRLVVCSKFSGQIHGLAWDMDALEKTNKWDMEVLDEDSLPLPATEFLTSVRTGTVVVWRKIKSVRELNERNAVQVLDKEALHARRYLEMIFHRYLSGEQGARKITMTFNGKKLIPWDPFCRDQKNTRNLGDVAFKVPEAGKSSVVVRPFLLPSQDGFSSSEAFNLGAGIRKWNDMQGFYFYRNNRMVDYSGWNWMRAKDEKTKFLRVAIDYDVNPKMDSLMKINVAKQTASIPASVRDEIKEYLSKWAVLARKAYPTTRGVSEENKSKKYSLLQVEKLLQHVATSGEKPVVSSLFSKLRKSQHIAE